MKINVRRVASGEERETLVEQFKRAYGKFQRGDSLEVATKSFEQFVSTLDDRQVQSALPSLTRLFSEVFT